MAVPTPGIDGQALAVVLRRGVAARLFGWVNLFSGGALERFSVFALGIMPYISVAIILDLLKVAWPYLDELYKEGEAGRRKISQYTRYGTVGLAIVQGLMIAISLEKYSGAGRRLGGLQSGLVIPHHDGSDGHRRHHVHDVDGRADHRARNRQRHLADHHGRDRGAPAQRDWRPRCSSCARAR